LLEHYDNSIPINIGFGSDIAIRDLATLISNIIGYDGEIKWNEEMPDGAPQKLLDSSRMRKLGWKPEISLEQGVKETYDWYVQKVEVKM
jgi:GDP-L-fucose synthase